MRDDAGSLDEDPLVSDQDSSDEPDLKPCPYCRAKIAESAEVCPSCGSYLSAEDRGSPRQPPLIMMTAITLIIAMALGYVCLK
jgi:predicted nucleic acid-binding Zn ribbon protein